MNCSICGKEGNLINPMKVVQREPLICSVECLQTEFDKSGLVIKSPEGGEIRFAPGDIRVQPEQVQPEPVEVKIEMTWEPIDGNSKASS